MCLRYDNRKQVHNKNYQVPKKLLKLLFCSFFCFQICKRNVMVGFISYLNLMLAFHWFTVLFPFRFCFYSLVLFKQCLIPIRNIQKCYVYGFCDGNARDAARDNQIRFSGGSRTPLFIMAHLCYYGERHLWSTAQNRKICE